ncbi:MAG: S49 family peptidase [Bacteroidetes bacterium]|nr:S49 family peptidase [Bacteroidota bacterium]
MTSRLLLFTIFLLNSIFTFAGDSTRPVIYKLDIKDEIGPPVWRQTQKAFEEATKIEADYFLIHMNTYGGTLIHADSIRTEILKSKIPVYVYIDNNAASAGALIAIACDSIYMSPGANIGAATVVNQTGEQMPDKYQSYMRSMMRSTAEMNGRDPLIAQAMVDPKVYVKGVNDSGQVITFTTSEAIKHHFCEAQVNSIKEILERSGIGEYSLVEHYLSPLEKIISFLINPVVSGILIMIIIAGIYYELQTPGIGFPLAAAVIAALLYFAPLYLEGLAAHWEILIFIIGLILVIIELFAFPGFGVIGIAGVFLVITGLTLSMIDNIGFDFELTNIGTVVNAFFIVIIAMFLSLAISIFITGKLLTSPFFPALALNDVQRKEEGYVGVDMSEAGLIGRKGIAITILRPSGKIEISGEIYDAMAETGFIEKDSGVQVIRQDTAQLVVRKTG